MTDRQYFFLVLVLILNSIAIILIGLTQHYQTKAINALTAGLTAVVAEITRRPPR